jgi:hypothetical protein
LSSGLLGSAADEANDEYKEPPAIRRAASERRGGAHGVAERHP